MTQPTPEQRPAATWTYKKLSCKYGPRDVTTGTGGPSGKELGPSLVIVRCRCGKKLGKQYRAPGGKPTCERCLP